MAEATKTSKSSEIITLFDLSKANPLVSWSPNAWKCRIVLNYKSLDYQTEWLGFLDIKGRLENHNHGGRGLSVTKNHTGFEYSVPAMMDADGTYVMDSLNIAEYLEKKYPEPSIRLHSPKVRHMVDIVNRVMITLAPNFIVPLTNNILMSPHREYFIETRSARYGMPLERVEATMGGEGTYDAAAPLIKELTRMLEEHPEGPFLLGSEPSYGGSCLGGFDGVLANYWQWGLRSNVRIRRESDSSPKSANSSRALAFEEYIDILSEAIFSLPIMLAYCSGCSNIR